MLGVAPGASLSLVTAPFASLELVTAPFLIFEVVTEFFFRASFAAYAPPPPMTRMTASVDITLAYVNP